MNDAEQRISADLSCTRCGYNLRSLLLTARCPECGQFVQRTLADGKRQSRKLIRELQSACEVMLIGFGIAALGGLWAFVQVLVGMIALLIGMAVAAYGGSSLPRALSTALPEGGRWSAGRLLSHGFIWLMIASLLSLAAIGRMRRLTPMLVVAACGIPLVWIAGLARTQELARAYAIHSAIKPTRALIAVHSFAAAAFWTMLSLWAADRLPRTAVPWLLHAALAVFVMLAVADALLAAHVASAFRRRVRAAPLPDTP